VWLRDVKEALGDALDVEWRPFVLEQVNYHGAEEWYAWDQPSDKMRGVLALRAAEAARSQGHDAFERMHYALLEARHVHHKTLNQEQTIVEAARQAGLDVEQLLRDIRDPGVSQRIGASHMGSLDHIGVFGTPTLIFEDGRAAFLRLKPTPPKSEALRVFNQVKDLVVDRPFIDELKRPTPTIIKQ